MQLVTLTPGPLFPFSLPRQGQTDTQMGHTVGLSAPGAEEPNGLI